MSTTIKHLPLRKPEQVKGGAAPLDGGPVRLR